MPCGAAAAPSTTNVALAPPPPPPARRSHVAYTYSKASSTLVIYVNGAAVQTCSSMSWSPNDMSSITTAYLARPGAVGDPYYSGSMYDVQIFDEALR
jgi:hypothetical protein